MFLHNKEKLKQNPGHQINNSYDSILTFHTIFFNEKNTKILQIHIYQDIIIKRAILSNTKSVLDKLGACFLMHNVVVLFILENLEQECESRKLM